MNPKVSVILPSLNVKGYIEECVESVLAQTMKEIEVICVDAGSEDGTYEIIENYAHRDDRMVVLQSDKTSYGRQVNMGLDYAKGDYIAIVETDDFIAKDMFEYLYNLAEIDCVDYAKADFDAYITLHDGGRLFRNERLFVGKKGLYEEVIAPEEYLELFTNDSAIWKGIYSRDFLQRNHIRFHESKGAAFQDIGFMMQVLCHAKRAVYTDRSFYRYCLDRVGASSNQLDCLNYVYQEFRWLMDEQILDESMPKWCWKGIYRRMASAFMCEADKYAKHSDLQYNRDKVWETYYSWLQNSLNTAMERGILDGSDFCSQSWFELNLITHSFKGYLEYCFVKNKLIGLKENRLLNEITNRRVVIFGCGAYGFQLYRLLDKNKIEVLAVCDNNEEMWGMKIGNVELQSPEKCMDQYKEGVFVIASKYHADTIAEQLLKGGIRAENIRKYLIGV